jgi:hypothetical protein
MTPLVTVDNILDSGGDHLDWAAKATPVMRANAAVLAARVSSLLAELGYTKRPPIKEGLRPENASWGAKLSAHKEGKAVDFIDRDSSLKAKCTPVLLKKHGLRMEHPDEAPTWCHLDTRQPFGSIFHP